MENNKTEKEIYPIFELDRSDEVSANTRNVSYLIWMERLSNISLIMIFISCLCCLISTIFVFKQPFPNVYVSTVDGTLIPVETWSRRKEDIAQTIEMLEVEEKSLLTLKSEDEKKLKDEKRQMEEMTKAPLPNEQKAQAASQSQPTSNETGAAVQQENKERNESK